MSLAKSNIIPFDPSKKSSIEENVYPFDMVMKSNKSKGQKQAQDRKKANSEVLKSYQIKR